jgi:glycosyltransferase involved in cell wall biosynthesis
MEQYRVIVAHPGTKHSYRIAEALKKQGLLYKYVTTIYNKDKFTLIKVVSKFIRGDNLARATKRRCEHLEDSDVLLYNEFSSLLLLAFQKIDKNGNLSNRLSELISKLFQKKVARCAIKNKVDAVIMYDTNAKTCFDILQSKAPEIKRIIDNAHPVRNYLYKIYQDNLEASGEFVKTYAKCGYLLNKEHAATFGEEAKTANYHIVASAFSKDAVKYNGFDGESIFIVPYGVSSDVFIPATKDYDNLNILFVGEINQRKGIVQILEAAKKLSSNDITFNLVGSGKEYCNELYKPYEKYVNFRGRVSFKTLVNCFKEASIFVFPSMGEGFGLVILEAMSAGLPIICSKNCVGLDVVEEGHNGFVIDAGDTKALVDKIEWFQNHKQLIPQMSENARRTALKYTWQGYEDGIKSCLLSILGKNYSDIK